MPALGIFSIFLSTHLSHSHRFETGGAAPLANPGRGATDVRAASTFQRESTRKPNKLAYVSLFRSGGQRRWYRDATKEYTPKAYVPQNI